MRLTSTFRMLALILLCVNVSPVLAKAPSTAKILFTSGRDGNYEVYSMNPDGSEQVNLTQHQASDLNAVWSPTGEKILFISDRGGRRDLYLMDPDGSKVRRVLKRKAKVDRKHPTWSPDGKQIAYKTLDWGGPEYGIHIVILGEQEAEHIVEGSYPAWSPDGMEIACTVSQPLSAQLTFINVHTRTQEKPLSKKLLLWQYDPSWSAAGDKLAFAGNKHPIPAILDLHKAWADKRSIYIVNRDGTGLRLLVNEAGPKASAPALSPNGDELLYTQEVKGRLQIFKLNIDSGVRTQLTHDVWNLGGDWFDPAYALPVAPQPDLLTTTWGQLKKE